MFLITKSLYLRVVFFTTKSLIQVIDRLAFLNKILVSKNFPDKSTLHLKVRKIDRLAFLNKILVSKNFPDNLSTLHLKVRKIAARDLSLFEVFQAHFLKKKNSYKKKNEYSFSSPFFKHYHLLEYGKWLNFPFDIEEVNTKLTYI